MVGRNKWLRTVVVCLLLAVCQPVLAKSWRALVIGNQAYQGGLKPLNNPVRDAEALADVLERLGFEVTLHRNVTKNQFWEVFQAFKQALKADSSEVALFFFSGHGLAAERSNYLMPVDARPEYLEDVAFHGIPMERVLGDIKTEGVRLRMIIVDACRDNANLKSKYRGGGNPGLVSMRAPVGTLIAFSAGPSQQAMDFINKDDKHSPYMTALLKYLPEPGLTAKEVFLKAGEEVAVMTSEKQIPSLQTSLVEQFRFNRGRGGEERRGPVEPAQPERVADGGSTPSPFRRPVPEEAPPAGSRPQAGQVFRDTLSDGTRGPAMVVIPAGEFWMGSPESEVGRESEERQHLVSVATFAMGQYEVTFAEYDKFCESTGRSKPDDEGDSGRGNRPVYFHYSSNQWNDVIVYIKWLSEQTGKQYRLPTEAEWEYAARAGTKTAYWWGEEAGHKWVKKFNFPAPVDSLEPNPWKLYGTEGNVQEWTCSLYSASYNGEETKCDMQTQTSPHSTRGGSVESIFPYELRSAYRRWKYGSGGINSFLGFRLARSL